MTDNELNIKVNADAESLKDLGVSLKDIESRIKQLTIEQKSSAIGSDLERIATMELEKAIKQKSVVLDYLNSATKQSEIVQESFTEKITRLTAVLESDKSTVSETSSAVSSLTKIIKENASAVELASGAYAREIALIERTKNVNNEATVGFQSANARMKESYFQTGEEIRRRMLPSMTAFTGILQDSPQFMMGFSQGMRSIGNNIEFFTQSMTQAMASGLTFKQAIGGMASSLAGPAGILFAVSAVTFALQVLPDLFKKIGDEAGSAADGGMKRFNEQATLAGRAMSDYSDMLKNREQDLKTFSEKRLQSEMTTHANILFMLDQKIRSNELLIARLKDKNKLSDEEKESLKVLEENQRNYNKQLSDEEAFTKAITKERQRRASDSSKSSKSSPIYGMSTDFFIKFDEAKAKEQRKAYINYRLDMMIEDRDAVIKALDDEQKLKDENFNRTVKLIEKEQDAQEKAARSWVKSRDAAWGTFDVVTAGLRSLLNTELMVTRQAKDGWDAAWIAMENTAMNVIANVTEKFLESQLFDLLLGIFTGGGSAGVSLATQTAGGISGLGGWNSSMVFPFANGGWIPEPVLGVGASGRRYAFGERGPEYVHSNSSLRSVMNERGGGIGGGSAIIKAINNLSLRMDISSSKLSVAVEGGNRIRNPRKY